MILRGILDRSLSRQLTIRGFAPIKELARISKADYSYQRDPIKKQEEIITTFLEEEQYLFFPEVILSFKLKRDYTLPRVNKDLRPISEIETTGKFKSNVDKTSIKVKTVRYRDSDDIRGIDSLKAVELELDEEVLQNAIISKNQPFNRVDGNHRLRAAEESKSSKVAEMNVPFCIILSEELHTEIDTAKGKVKRIDDRGEKFEKVVFHNINTKTIPLTSEENLKVILDDEKNFKNEELKDKFGWEYYAIRQVFKKLPENISEVYPYLGKTFLETPRTLSKSIIEVLIKNKVIKKADYNVERIISSLKEVNHIFGNYSELKGKEDISIVVASLYLTISGKSDINLFVKWLLKNYINELSNLDPISLINIYKKIRETKEKQIFVSMQFDNETKPHYEAIKKAVEEINREFNLDIKLREIRIDDFNRGHSYKIDDEILTLIEESGLLIADLSAKNVNVYQELGYLMGLNQGKGLKQENFILIKKEEKNSKDSDIGFNIRPFQQLRFKSDLRLVEMLKGAIKEYYEL